MLPGAPPIHSDANGAANYSVNASRLRCHAIFIAIGSTSGSHLPRLQATGALCPSRNM